MDSSNSSSMSITPFSKEQFVAWEEDDLCITSNLLKDANSLSELMKIELPDMNEDEVDKLADLLLKGIDIKGKSVKHHHNIDYFNALKHLKDRALLMMYMPGDEEEARARELQYDSFCEIYPGMKSKVDQNPRLIKRVDHLQDIKTSVGSFWKEYAKKCKKLVVIINGHGTPGYLQIGNESVELDKVINLIKEPMSRVMSMSKGHGIRDLCLPKVEIVLAQCFGYVYDGPWKDGNVEVIPLTHKGLPKSRFRIYRDKQTMDRSIKASIHEQLNKFGEKEAKKKVRKKSRKSRRSKGKAKAGTILATQVQAEGMATAN